MLYETAQPRAAGKKALAPLARVVGFSLLFATIGAAVAVSHAIASQPSSNTEQLFIQTGTFVRRTNSQVTITAMTSGALHTIVFSINVDCRLDPVNPGDRVNAIYSKAAGKNILVGLIQVPTINSDLDKSGKHVDQYGVSQIVQPEALPERVTWKMMEGVSRIEARGQNAPGEYVPPEEFVNNRSYPRGVVTHVKRLSKYDFEIDVDVTSDRGGPTPMKFMLNTIFCKVEGELQKGSLVEIIHHEQAGRNVADNIVVNPDQRAVPMPTLAPPP
jgi:Cu/Ag efflux protein CusF